MDQLPFSVTSSLLGLSSSVDALHYAITQADRVSIIRECSDIISFTSDILDAVVPENSSLNIE